jgi:hypothetical protein
MKKKFTLFMTILLVMSSSVYAQTPLKEYEAGHVFHISIPEYMGKTIGLNNSATIQYKSEVKDVYGFVIEDNKEELKLAELNYSSINEFYEGFIKDFLTDEDDRIVSQPLYKKNGDINFVESDVTYYDKEAKINIYYLVGIVETKSAYYKVLSWSAVENKDKFKADFQKIVYSLKD